MRESLASLLLFSRARGHDEPPLATLLWCRVPVFWEKGPPGLSPRLIPFNRSLFLPHTLRLDENQFESESDR